MRYRLAALGAILIIAGSVLAFLVQGSGGVEVREARWRTPEGAVMSGLLYRPPGLEAGRRAPAVLLSHGYINTREMQSPFAIELARRGFVVLAMDMTGHGGSGGNVGAAGFGGPSALAFLRSQPFVDRDQIGLAGHSMGGGPVLAAARAEPEGYRAVVLVGSAPGLFGPPDEVRPDFPRNLNVVFGGLDEFSALMWRTPKGTDLPGSEKLKAVFGVASPVEPGRIYGDPTLGTARRLDLPRITHPWEHFSSGGVAPAVDWMQARLEGEARPLPAGDQVWVWKEAGTLLALVGAGLLLLGAFELALGLPWLGQLRRSPEPAAAVRGIGGWLALGLTAVLPALTYLPFMKLGALWFPSALFPQWVQNQLLAWALANTVLAIVIALFLRRGRPVFSVDIPRSLVAAVLSVGAVALALAAVDRLLHVDFRFWVIGFRPLTEARWPIFLAYLPLWTLHCVIVVRGLCALLAVDGASRRLTYLTAAGVMGGGFFVLAALQYATLFATGLLLTPTEPLNVIVALQFIPLLALVGIIAVFTWRRTNSYLPGALICALFLSWYVTSGTANHWSAEYPMTFPPAARDR
ncbi:MAG: alpha/beta fold hydrolase [Phenylobacterium sp.]|jgi:pimeloyl-ACP methyl ester carboxylesterase|uniref:alpha/beta fold hydrolase n=1 Tax=Phenylobacterium sp. TaxID=1871053 RepID=UPI0025EA0D18|nr:alpha/beta fold hydrolase [Phenylobacterium sp.]MCA3736627.1 alpha/beta fold hydrolase [Phenylobacterium sp.]MCA3746661.1 alpha/beta fold hydrolase [Phenylobacterium sp.]MCA3751792.1 alpha/beta fold hydrolase [Phenylobacterium sp.]MCA6241014.1 alpha/beta fold hydrolase [Phenylobacterium sp.]MCA6260663.1 alpha/beta fold hydrolase [Phenylobacterium sp.]